MPQPQGRVARYSEKKEPKLLDRIREAARVRRRKLPVVLSVEEVKRTLAACAQGTERLFLSLLYGTGMRLTEAACERR